MFKTDLDQWNEIRDALSKNKVRSFLTAFGIFWGVFMLILLMGGGNGMKSMLGQTFSGFASNSGFMIASTTSLPYKGLSEERQWNMTNEDVVRVRHCVPEIDVISPIIIKWGAQATNNERAVDYASITGEYASYGLISDPRIQHGRAINDIDIAQRRKVCVVGERIAGQLFPGEDNVCGHNICVDGIFYTIIGQSKRSGGINFGGSPDRMIELPFTTMQQTYGYGNEISILCFTAKEGHPISKVQEKVTTILRRSHDIHPDDQQAIVKVNAEAMFDMVDNLFKGITILVWMIGIGTILSGAVGVSNIMMVTVRERTTEIGIRRAIGATPADIMQQILSESMVLTLLAGMSGLSAAVGILAMANRFAHNSPGGSEAADFLISFPLATGATLVIALLGLLAGITPAVRAMHIRPVEAMRSDE